jgi:signal transduction histidine kinase/ligand-binding sensor domain-containing protein
MRRIAAALALASSALGIPRSAAQEFGFQRLTTDDGLSDNAVNCVLQDRAGFLWIGTEKGLDRFDGQRVDAVADAPFAITALAEDAQGVLWAATRNNGLLRIHRQARRAEPIAQADGHQLTSVFNLNDTTLLLGSRELTLLFLDKRTLALTYWADSTSIDPAQALRAPSGRTGWCHAITPLNDSLLWIGLLNGQTAFIADRRSGRIRHHLIIRRAGSESYSAALLHQGLLYSGGWQHGLDALTFALPHSDSITWAPRTRLINAPDEVNALVAWYGGSILCGTRASGLLRYTPSNEERRIIRHRLTDPSSLPSDRIRCLYVDRCGILWVGTANGLAYHAPTVWPMRVEPLHDTKDPDEPELLFHRMEAEPSTGFRLFTSNGFYVRSIADGPIRHVPLRWNGNELQPSALLREGNGALIGTEYGFVRQRVLDGSALEAVPVGDGSGYFYKPGNMYQVRHISKDTLVGKPVLVVGTLGFGVHVLDASSMTLLGSGMPLAAHTVKARSLVADMVRDARGNYWMASGDGLYAWSCREPVTDGFNRAPRPVSHAGILAAGSSIAKLEPIGDALWAIARDGRLLRIAGGRLMEHLVPWKVGALHGLCADAQGRLWMSSDNGLIRFDPHDRSFLHVPVNEGSRFRKLTRAMAMLNDGRIAFAADNTVFTFDPAVFDSLPPLPTAYLSSATAAGNPVQVQNAQATLSYRAGAIDIGVSALAFGFPGPLTFDHRLDGVEPEWRSTAAREAIRYAGIPVGEHRLLVRVQDPYGRIGPEQVLLTISVEGPFWQQWWFYAIAAAIVCLGFLAWSRYRIAQALKLQAVRNRIASDLHDEVGSSLSSITIGAQLAKQLSTAENEQVKAILGRIGETSSESLRSISDIVWAIDPKNDQGEALVKRMRRIANVLLESKGIEVAFTVTGGVEQLKLPMNARKEIVLIYKEAVHNASKYSNATHVQVELTVKQSNLMVHLQDNGKGFEPAMYPDGHGLGSMKRRADVLGAAFELQSAIGSGTTVKLKVDLTGMRD